MSTNKLDKILKQGENETVEFKQNFNDSAIETIVAFANTKGGSIFIGVKDNGAIIGIKIGKETIQKWLNEIKNKTQPAIIPSFQVLSIKNYTILQILVAEFPVKPLSFKGRYYKRINNSNHLLNANEITEMNLQSLQVSWDSYKHPSKNIFDLNEQKILNFTQKVNDTERFNFTTNWKQNLEKLNLITENDISHAAWLLFANKNIGYNVHIGRFKTNSTIIDDKMLSGTLYEVVEETLRYIIAHLKVAFEISGEKSNRTEFFEYPLPAIRELVLNAIVHRDYTSPIDVQIKIFDNKITFFNPGKLYGDLTVSQLKKDNYQANTRNKLIAEVFYLSGDIEKYGSGFVRIRDEIKKYPTMQFNFEELPNGFLTELAYTKQKITKNVTENVIENVIENVTEKRLGKILQIIKNKPSIKTAEIAIEFKLTKRTILRDIEKLKKANLIEYVGSPKKGNWKLR